MARIKHIAIRTPDPEKTAAFYKAILWAYSRLPLDQ